MEAISQNIEDKFRKWIKNAIENSIDRDYWSYLLGVSKPAISQWVNGKTIPSWVNLSGILCFLRQNKEDKILEEFESIKYTDLKKITPNWYKFKQSETLNDYLLGPKVDQLIIQIKRFPQKDKELLLKLFVTISFSYNNGKDGVKIKILKTLEQLNSQIKKSSS